MIDWQRRPEAPVRVDCHIHLFPDKLFAAIRQWFERVGWEIRYPYRTQEVLALLKGWGVECAWALTYAHRPGIAEGVNAWLGELRRREPMLRGFFSVHPEDDNPAAVAERALDLHGLDGLKLHAEVQQLAVDDARLDGVFDLMEERRKPCVLHTGDAPYPETKPNLDVSCVRERLRRNPELVAVIAHLGAFQTEQYLELTRDYPNLYLEVSFTNYPGVEPRKPFDYAILEPFADRLLFGSDFPNLTFSYADQADAWWAFEWVRRDAEAFFGGRAKGILS
ncbi:MAG: hypothetical protein C4523_01320 [Myxococcales bacterium]|nr:MAG: hypothetical protein C4523_01320 [Myxococcales bacterium]